MRLLILGGTLFVGKALAQAAVDQGWSVTTFNRGLSGLDVDGVAAIRGDRGERRDVVRLVDSGSWDAVVDCGGYVPRDVLTVAQALEPWCARYVFVSTVSVYKDWPILPLSEQSVVLECPADAGPDFGPDDVEDGPTRYGRLKAGCEDAVSTVFGAERSTSVRLGVVLGPGEYVGRLPWRPSRIAAGGTVLAPGSPGRTIQPVDVRDVADFILLGAQAGLSGAFNVAAPNGGATFLDLLQACIETTGSAAELRWLADDVLTEFGVRQWSELPLWRTMPGVWQVNTRKAVSNGLVCRPLADTVRDTWRWMTNERALTGHERSVDIGLAPLREQQILAALR